MNYTLAKEIYGIVPWFMDYKSLPVLLNSLKNNKDFEATEEKLNSVFAFDTANADLMEAGRFGWDGVPESVSEVIGLVRINGPITKSGGASSFGMDYVSQTMLKMAKEPKVKGFIILSDSGGGSSSAVEIMDETIKAIKKTKPVHALIEKGGMAASAMYGIISPCNKIWSESEMSIVGSTGTMIQFEGKAANSIDPDGTKNIRLYASKSIKKNQGFEEALNNDNYEVLVNELLNPINENFLQTIVGNRPVLKGSDFENGETKFSKDAIGTYIDGIKTLAQVSALVMQDYKENYLGKNQNSNINLKNQKMTAEELQQQFPAVYNGIFQAGVTSGAATEKDSVGSWLAHYKSDPELVLKGVKSDALISQTEREELLVKAASTGKLEAIASDSAVKVVTPESSKVEISAEEKELENIYGDITNKI